MKGNLDLIRIPVFRIIGAVIPDRNGTCTILTFRDSPFEMPIIERMIFHRDSEVLLTKNGRYTLWYRPALQNSFPLQPEVTVLDELS